MGMLIPIAGGKGGVGKTFLAANLGIALAEQGKDVIVADLDLGGSNMYSFLGLTNRYPGIGDFLKTKSADLQEMLVPTGAPRLRFLPGEGRTPFMANLAHVQKRKLISRIVKLPCDYLLLDLGAGTTFNTLDFFLLSDHGIIVTTPEYPSIMNMMSFLKHLILRAVEKKFSRNFRVREGLKAAFNKPITDERLDIPSIRAMVEAVDPASVQAVDKLCRKYRPRVVFNMGDHPDEILVTEQVSQGLRDILTMEVDYFGFVFRDPNVRQSINRKELFFPNHKTSLAAGNIAKIAERILRFGDSPVPESARLLLNYARNVFESS